MKNILLTLVLSAALSYGQTPSESLSPQMLHQLANGRPTNSLIMAEAKQIKDSLAVINRNNADLSSKLDSLSKRVDRIDVTGVSGNESRLTRLEDSVQEIRNAEDRSTQAALRSADELKAWLKIGIGTIFSGLVGVAANVWRVRSMQRKRAVYTDDLLAKMELLIEAKVTPRTQACNSAYNGRDIRVYS